MISLRDKVRGSVAMLQLVPTLTTEGSTTVQLNVREDEKATFPLSSARLLRLMHESVDSGTGPGHQGPYLFSLLQHCFLSISSASESTFFCFLFISFFASFLSPSSSLLLYFLASFISPCLLLLFTPTLHSVFFLSPPPPFSHVPTSWAVPMAWASFPHQELPLPNSPNI